MYGYAGESSTNDERAIRKSVVAEVTHRARVYRSSAALIETGVETASSSDVKGMFGGTKQGHAGIVQGREGAISIPKIEISKKNPNISFSI